MLLRHHPHPSLHNALYIHSRFRQYHAGVTANTSQVLTVAWRGETTEWQALGLGKP